MDECKPLYSGVGFRGVSRAAPYNQFHVNLVDDEVGID
jgi:hypothetical protein